MQARSSHTDSQSVVYKGTFGHLESGRCGVVGSMSALESEDPGSIPGVSDTFSKCPNGLPHLYFFQLGWWSQEPLGFQERQANGGGMGPPCCLNS